MAGWPLSGEDIVITDYQGRQIRLTQRQWHHAVERRSYMVGMEWAVRETLEDPQEVHKSQRDPDTVKLYYRWFINTRVGDKWVCVVVKFLEDDAFILTAYETHYIKPGEMIWRKES